MEQEEAGDEEPNRVEEDEEIMRLSIGKIISRWTIFFFDKLTSTSVLSSAARKSLIATKSSCLDSFAVSVFENNLVELTNTETAAATPPTAMQIFQRASDQWKVLKRCDSWWISSPMHLISLLGWLLGVFVHHRRAGEDFSVTFASFCHHWDNEIWGNQVCICFGLIFGFLMD